MVDLFKIVFGALGSGFILKIIDHLIRYRKYTTDVRRVEIENDGLVSDHWKSLYEELRKMQQDQEREIDRLIRENEELREQCNSLQKQIDLNLH